ncbi:MAG TPA: glutamate 5-kinase [Acidimicrobiales bacterium]|nr:glutamate 5-kinase [Acidimicrobiales bacterium]
MIVVVKIGTSSVTTSEGLVNYEAVARLCHEVGSLRREGHEIVLVSSGAVTAGVAALRPDGGRPTDAITLQALSAVGQPRLMRVYDDALHGEGLVAGQVLLVPNDFGERRQYLHARATLLRLLELGVVPVVNENDALADDEIRFGDNDRIAALVANLIGAQLMVLLTDTPGLFDQDPRYADDALLVEEVVEFDEALERAAGGPGSVGSSGGMASKLAAARIASWSGVRVVIAKSDRSSVVADAVHSVSGVGTVIAARERRIPARKLWIAFALPASARVTVDEGAAVALVERDASLLLAGVRACAGGFVAGDAIEVVGIAGGVFAKGIARLSSIDVAAHLEGRDHAEARRSSGELIHRDDLVVLLGAISPRDG